MVSNERSGPVSPLTPAATETASVPSAAANADRAAGQMASLQTASFGIGELRLELSAAPGMATIAILAGSDRDAYTLDPSTLGSWAESSRRLLALAPATTSSECAEFRAPFLTDIDGRAAVAFEAAVTDGAVAYRLLVVGAETRVGAFATTRATLAGVIEAAAGAVSVARTGRSDERPPAE